MNSRLKNLMVYVGIAIVLIATAYFVGSTTEKYAIRPILINAEALCNNHECLIVLSPMNMGKSTNVLTRLIPKMANRTIASLLTLPEYKGSGVIIFHYTNQHLQRFELSDAEAVAGRFSVLNGSLVYFSRAWLGHPAMGKKWTGSGFTDLSAADMNTLMPPIKPSADDSDDDAEIAQSDPLKDAGWTQKYFYPMSKDKTLNLHLDHTDLLISIKATPQGAEIIPGIPSLDLAGPGLRTPAENLWTAPAWREVSESEYARVMGPKKAGPAAGALIAASLALSLVSYLPFLFAIYKIFRIKSNILKTQSKQHTFQPVTQDLFPQLDRVSVDRFSKELEALGFTLQMEFTLVGNLSKTVGSYARLYTNIQQNMFAEVFQVFVGTKPPRPVSANVSTSFSDGWILTTANTKPMAMSALQRLPRSLSTLMPGASVRDLYQSHLQKRNEIAFALGVSILTNTTREAYIERSNRSSAQRYEKLQKSSIILGMLNVLRRKISPSYEWMGDFKKEAAKRGSFTMAAAAGKGR